MQTKVVSCRTTSEKSARTVSRLTSRVERQAPHDAHEVVDRSIHRICHARQEVSWVRFTPTAAAARPTSFRFSLRVRRILKSGLRYFEQSLVKSDLP